MKKSARLLSQLFWLEFKRIVFGTKYFAEIDITDNCNLRCKHCYHFQSKDFATTELSVSIWKERFEELRKSGIRAVLLVGGEPALRPDILLLAEEKFPLVYVITNGTIKIPASFGHRFFVSVDGTPNVNDSIRGKGVFSKIMENYSGDKRVVVNMTLTKNNYNELEGVVKIAVENGFDGVVCNICAGEINNNNSWVVKKEERTAIIEEMKRVKSLYPKNFLMTNTMIEWYQYPNHASSCAWREHCLHFDVSWKRRKCFGNETDCSNCGCLAGSLQTPAKMMLHVRALVKIAGY